MLPFQPSPRSLAIFALGLAMAALPSLAWPAAWPLWMVYCGVLALAWGVDAVLCPWRVQCQLEAPDTLAMAATGTARLALLPSSRETRRGLPVEVRLELSENLAAPPSAEGRMGSEALPVEVPLTPRRRGRGRIEEAWLRYAGPLGLTRRTLRVPLDHTVDVVPNLSPVHAAALSFANPRETLAGLKIERFAGDGSEFESLREYQPGLDPRSIDWKASARHTRLLSREVRAERNHQIVLALDTGRLMAEPLEGVPRIDHAIHAALLMGYVSLRHGDRVSLYSFDERPGPLSPPRGGVGSLGHLMRYTSELGYSEAETNYTLALTELSSRLRRRSLVVVMTELVDTVTAELMVENVLRLARRHLVLFVALRSPELAGLTEADPANLGRVERAVIAESLALERQLVIRRLRRQGVTCVDEVPSRLGTTVLNRYLEIKRRERI